MRFNFSTFNHCPQGKIILEDITRIMGHQLIALGHDVQWKEYFIFDGYNFILESFADSPNTIPWIADAHKAGAKFIYIATEEPTDKGFNHGLDPAMIDRQNAFAEAAQYASGILHLIPGQHIKDWYAQYAPTAYAELGYAPTLDPVGEGPEATCDFGFYGKMTWRREKVLDELAVASGLKVVRLTDFWTPGLERDARMRQARVIPQIRANLEVQLVSSTRCATALYMGRPVVAEPHDLSKPWDEVVHFSPTYERFIEDALTAARGDWRRLHGGQMKKFKARLTPEVCIGNPLRQIGVG